MLNFANDQYWFEIDRAHAIGQSNYGGEGTSTQSCYDLRTLKKDVKKWVGILRNLHRNNASGIGIDDL
ncbi:hypothetical protein MKX03_000362, partial [Papaver bracteatum]